MVLSLSLFLLVGSAIRSPSLVPGGEAVRSQGSFGKRKMQTKSDSDYFTPHMAGRTCFNAVVMEGEVMNAAAGGRRGNVTRGKSMLCSQHNLSDFRE